jgi:hypothetical protein
MPRRSIAISVLLAIPMAAQPVISTISGLIDCIQGAVFVDGRPMPPIRDRFPEIPRGSVLSTADGMAEVLINPETFLWIGPNSAIRMRRTSLSDSRVEVLKGSVVLQTERLEAGDAVTLIQDGAGIEASPESLYRLDGAPPRLVVLGGTAHVTGSRVSAIIREPGAFSLASGLIEPLPRSAPDALALWVLEREKTIAAADGETPGAARRRRRMLFRPFPTTHAPFAGRN